MRCPVNSSSDTTNSMRNPILKWSPESMKHKPLFSHPKIIAAQEHSISWLFCVREALEETLARKTLKWRHEENGGFLFHHCFKASKAPLASAFCIRWGSGYHLLLQDKWLLEGSNSLKLLGATQDRLEVYCMWRLKLGPTVYTPS